MPAEPPAAARPAASAAPPAASAAPPAASAAPPAASAAPPRVDPPGAETASAVPLTAATFRAVLGRFATGVTVVTTVADGVDHAMTASAFASVSLNPLLVLVCVAKRARFHAAVAAAHTWAVSVLSEEDRDASVWFATTGRPLETQFQDFPHTRGRRTGAPLLDSAIATLECRTWQAHDGGDHTILVGEVLSLGLPRPDVAPLVYYHGHYHTLAAPP